MSAGPPSPSAPFRGEAAHGIPARPARKVSPRDVLTVLWVTLTFLVFVYLLYEVRRVLVWIMVAAFLAAVLSPLVALLARKGVRRGYAVAGVVIVFLVGASLLIYAFVSPIVDQSRQLAENLPELAEEVQQAPLVRSFVDRLNLEDRVSETSADLPKRLLGFSGPLFSAFRTLGGVVVGLLTVFVLTIFLMLYGPGFIRGALGYVHDPARRARIERIGNELQGAVSGWVAGNLVTSVIAAVVSVLSFLATGLPYSVLLGIWVGIADLLPLVGATLGAIPAIIVAFLQSTPTGIIVTVYFIAYQQIENHVLQPYIYGKTIQLNPFIVLVAVLIGAELAGFLGALFALPVAGAVQVMFNNLRREPMGSGSDAGVLEVSQGDGPGG